MKYEIEIKTEWAFGKKRFYGFIGLEKGWIQGGWRTSEEEAREVIEKIAEELNIKTKEG